MISIFADLSLSNFALDLHKDALTPAALDEAFHGNRKAYVELINVSDELQKRTPVPKNFPKCIVVRYGLLLLSDEEDMSQIDIIDFGKCNVHLNCLTT